MTASLDSGYDASYTDTKKSQLSIISSICKISLQYLDGVGVVQCSVLLCERGYCTATEETDLEF